MKILNIFCDASIKSVDDPSIKFMSSGGFVAVDNDVIIDTQLKFMYGCTNNEAEIYSLEMSVLYALSRQNLYDTINIFSDSKICVVGLKEWVFNWTVDKNNILYNTSGLAVANQSYFVNIIDNLRYCSKGNINILHQKGHVNTNKIEQVENAQRVFRKTNHFDISYNDMVTISKYNDIIDKVTKEDLKLRIANKYNLNKMIKPASFVFSGLDNYKESIPYIREVKLW